MHDLIKSMRVSEKLFTWWSHLLITISASILLNSGVARGNKGNSPPPKPGKFAKDEEQPTPQPAMRIDSSRKFKFSLNFSKYLLTFS